VLVGPPAEESRVPDDRLSNPRNVADTQWPRIRVTRDGQRPDTEATYRALVAVQSFRAPALRERLWSREPFRGLLHRQGKMPWWDSLHVGARETAQ
jgi:hypothetical protein